jgi:hypothetical protein
MKLKVVATDSGTEFNGEFLAYLESEGIIKRNGQGYDHHFPPLAENAHRIITAMSRAMLFESKLPAKYYGEAMLTACYVLNRWQADKSKKSRYEIFFGKIPKTSHLKPFGSICYSFIAPEKRNKIQPIRDRCRLIGYGDDDDTEEMAGNKLLLESYNSILYSNDVHFTEEPICVLPGEPVRSYDPDDFEVFQ